MYGRRDATVEYRHGPMFCQTASQGNDMITGQSAYRISWRVLLGLCLWPGFSAAAVDCQQWHQVLETAEGPVLHRCHPGSPVDEVMIEAHFRSAPERLYALVNDYDAFADFIPDVAESRVLERHGMEQWVFHRLHFPGPVADRAYVMKSTAVVTPRPHPVWRVDWALSDRVFSGVEPAKGIHPDSLSGFWVIEPAGGTGMTNARYAVHSDPGGLLPAWLVMHMTDRYVQQVVAAVRTRLGE